MDRVIRLGLLLLISFAWLIIILLVWVLHFFYTVSFSLATVWSIVISSLVGLLMVYILKSQPKNSPPS